MTAAPLPSSSGTHGLLPCPFCGDLPTLRRPDACYQAACVNAECNFSPESGVYYNKNDCIAGWNQRPSPTPQIAGGVNLRFCSCKASQRDGQHMAWCPAALFPQAQAGETGNRECRDPACERDIKALMDRCGEMFAEIERLRAVAQAQRTPLDLAGPELNTLATDAFRQAAQASSEHRCVEGRENLLLIAHEIREARNAYIDGMGQVGNQYRKEKLSNVLHDDATTIADALEAYASPPAALPTGEVRGAIAQTLRLFKSKIEAGGEWSPVCQSRFDEATRALSSTSQLTAAPIDPDTPECSFCGARIFDPCRSVERSRHCELPPGVKVTSTHHQDAAK